MFRLNITHQGGTRSSAAMSKMTSIHKWAESHVPAFWADFLIWNQIDPGEPLHREVFIEIILKWGHQDISLQAQPQTTEFVSRTQDPLALAVVALVIPWYQFKFPYFQNPQDD